MNRSHTTQVGFSLVELSVATTILVVSVTVALAGMAYYLRSVVQSDVQNELDIDVQTSMERIKHDMRLSSLDEMFFYPADAAVHTAVSFPKARDDDGDGLVDLDGDGNIIWDKTHVYHVWAGEPHQLRLTTFDPRNNSLTDTERQEQIDSVVANGHGGLTHNSANSETIDIFQNLFDWSISPQGAVFDAYSTTTERDINTSLGSVVLSNGYHTFTFTVVGKNAASSGYKIGLDTLLVSPSYGEREAEAQLPVADQSGASASEQYMSSGSWSGNYQLYFPATGVGDYFTLSLENDRWEETNFRGNDAFYENTTVEFDQSLSPYDFVVTLNGVGWNWYAKDQTGDTNGVSAGDVVRGCAVRVLLRGEDMVSGAWLSFDGGTCWVYFRSGSNPSEQLKILKAYIGECVETETPSMDVVSGSFKQLKFGGADGCTISGGGGRWSDPAAFPIDKDKSYLVSFLVDSSAAKGSAWKWRELTDPSVEGCYIIPQSSSPGVSELVTPTWSTRGDVESTNCVLAVRYVYTTYPTNGYYVSPVMDTHLDAPAYDDISWDSYVPWGSSLSLKIRSGNSNDLSDAQAWTNIAAMTSPGSINPGDNRYCQFYAQFTPSSSGLAAPKLKDVTLRWTGEEQFVDVGGTFTKGPDYGIFELTVDGQEIKTGISIDLEIFKDSRGYRGTRTIRSALTSEITPRNSGR